ncbi:ABC transporter substrate-binding protein [Virgisporangium ochraceum]|uniref:Alpha-glucoside ABC transporter substrate-binding protein n=2 Tax=Virgisporangium ochraceum TaxID=65505 RepID=A0A8J3ZN91_9ACTN|nr:ABC transporter substrate-binding protein [Virgisporangium ochraceum]GIJ67414.1 alpha-glucoside ABC transporter substrate-binding protein [Virgisporangium ochraceum]
MSLRSTRPGRAKMRVAAAMASALGLVVSMAACGSTGEDEPAQTGSIDCGPYEKFGDLKGKTVSFYTGIVTPEDTAYINSFKPFEECTGVTIKYEGDKAFETQILVRARAGNAPDIAIVPQPGLLAQLVGTGTVKEAPPEVVENVDKFWAKDWKAYGTVNGKFYSAPMSANVKSLVWYSPKEFKDNNWKVPTTLDELQKLSDDIAAKGKKPWCAGIGSGEATGWPVTDWMEDMMLRLSGPQEYDKWVKHEIPFNSAGPRAALDEAGKYLKNDKYMNGGLGDVKSIATTTFQDAGLPILQGNCSLYRMASFYAANWTPGTTVAEDGQVFAFFLPGKTANDKPVLGGGEFVTAFADRPEVKAFQYYMSTDTWANVKSKLGGTVVSANKGLKIGECKCTDIDKLSLQLLQDPNAVFRFDGSDLMPAAVGSNAFWKQATAWITGQSTQATVDNIEAAWPK